ncbi:hypothetical protein [Halobacillus litoralis]|uniref:hypothetical protein n=1 Tax=Halobacillus litoralis TaxID=45668 RepID=UPI001CFCEE73|nr:hypothetical protein [Halobacillus litoralis]
MELEEVKQNLESLYIDYFDGLYSEHQLKMMLLKLYKQSKMTGTEDYNVKIKQLAEPNKEDGN